MAWDDLINSIKEATKILGKEFTEADIPLNWDEIVRLHKDLWKQVYAKGTGANVVAHLTTRGDGYFKGGHGRTSFQFGSSLRGY